MLTISGTDRSVTVSDGVDTKEFGKHRLGLFTYGDLSIEAFIAGNRAALKAKGMTDSGLNIMIGVSANEGNLDAINTWDRAFMSFGCFQWTLGVDGEQGELPALFRKIKAADADVFQRFFGVHGIDVWSGAGDTHGHLTLHGDVIDSAPLKEQFRAPEWCFRFWKAGQNEVVQAASVDHAYSRIKTFARSPEYRVHGHDIADIVTSEFGMALVLDNHVNRPAFVAGCLSEAVSAAGLTNKDPEDWSTGDERTMIEHYLVIRQTNRSETTGPMTDARARGERTQNYLNRGLISDRRGSFRFCD